MTSAENNRKSLVPRLGALVTALVGMVNIASALTPNIRWRGHLLLNFEAVETMRVFHALALPAGAALLLIAPYLLKRRRRALRAAIALMVVLGVVNLLKGLDWEEASLSCVSAAMLYWGRGAFPVVHEPITLRSAVWRAPLLGAAGLAVVGLAAWASDGHPSVGKVARETWDLLRFSPGPLRFEVHTAAAFDHRLSFAWIPLAVHLVELGTLAGIAYLIFRPLTAPRSLPGPGVRRRASELIRQHGRDTLSFFKLRPDKHLFFGRDGRSFVGYRVEAGVLLLSGDPVGPPEAFADLLLQVRAFARARGLKLGAVGASEAMLPLYDGLGLKTIYLGDEAVIELQRFSLEGRPIRKVRQSVSRLTKAGYTSELRSFRALDPETLAQVEHVLELGRQGAPERGFSMAMDSIRGEREEDTMFVLARDEAGQIRGVLHFVPCYGRPAVSLSFMRRDPGTPNGLTEFLVTEAVVHLRELGLKEMSLNFATAARFMHSPRNQFEKAVGKLARKLNRYFQIESLYKFNAKFFPRWEARYFVYEGQLGVPRAFLAAMWAEGQLPKPRMPRRNQAASRRAGQRRLIPS
ncbi:MAG TPA: phosphatidylglycerol lysyltransferase domain-containing protein [Solirubrobacteraceae bacterium]|jgi:lysyl-tRNA synthetase class 2|nr:phosphatidylglycerol lysyltransferase domain-containing protein [Solirubrobacteraceae bacterium]